MPSIRLRAVPFVLVALCGLSACGKQGAAGAGPGGNRGNQPVPVELQTVREQPWDDTLRALGTVHAHEAVTVTAKVSETVQQVHFESGQEVAKGAPLVTLSGQQQNALLASAQAQAKDAEAQFARLQQLGGQQLVARSAIDTARATRDAARAQAAQIRANLADRVIRAPFAGVLGIRQVSPGALVTPGTVIATLDDIARVYVDFPVPETELADVAPGQALVGRAGAYPGQTFEGRVATVAARLDAGTRAATVRGEFPNPERLLRPGMLVDVALVRATRDAARAQVAQIRANLADRVIRAPFAGVLGLRQVSPGALVTPGTVIATLDDIARVYVDFPVPETELAGVAPGQPLQGRAGAWPGRTFEGRVATVAARLDAGTRAATVRGDFPNPERLLRPGMLVDVALVRATRQALVVPELAVQQIGTETFVWRVMDDGTVEKADVVVGGRIPGKVMLREGLRAGDRIVVEGTGKLQPGAKVVDAKAAAPARG